MRHKGIPRTAGDRFIHESYLYLMLAGSQMATGIKQPALVQFTT
jgi:hypothetical protein